VVHLHLNPVIGNLAVELQRFANISRKTEPRKKRLLIHDERPRGAGNVFPGIAAMHIPEVKLIGDRYGWSRREIFII
jgi:hypothetical protein